MVDRGGLEGQQFGNYRLLHLLGQGGFAAVYLGVHIYLDTLAAIKVLHTQLASEDVENFHKEARTIARLIHPHIVRVLDYGVEGATPFLVVDYAPSGTLRKRHPKGEQLPLPTVVSYVTQIADALQYAHDQKVIHRDVKPENMLLGRRNEVLLSDFGIALVAQSSRYESTRGLQELAGTMAYMAPEQIQSQAVPQSDQYSLGVVVYEWLSGVRPFQGSFAEIAVKHTLVPPPPLGEKVPTLSPAVEEVVMRALAKDPKERFPNVQTFAEALAQASQKEPLSSPTLVDTSTHTDQPPLPAEPVAEGAVLPNWEVPPADLDLMTVPSVSSPPSKATSLLSETPLLVETAALTPVLSSPSRARRRRISRRKVVVGLAGLALAGAIGGGVALLVHNLGQQVMPVIGNGSTLYTFDGHTGWVWSVGWSPDGKRIASASGDETVQVWDAMDGHHLNVYMGHTDSVYTQAWSPDGRRIASAGNDKTVQIWDATYGDHFYTYSGHSSWIWSVAWSPDGKYIASGGGDKTVQVWNAADGLHRYTYAGHTGSIHAVAWSPDSRYLASASSDETVQIWEATTGRPIYTYQPYDTSAWALAWSPDGRRIASACDNKTVQVWDAMDGSHLYVYYGHTDFVYTVAWSPDGKRIASGGDDKTVQVWDAATGAYFYTYTGHTDAVRSVAWAGDSKRLASGSWDKTVQVWQAIS